MAKGIRFIVWESRIWSSEKALVRHRRAALTIM